MQRAIRSADRPDRAPPQNSCVAGWGNRTTANKTVLRCKYTKPLRNARQKVLIDLLPIKKIYGANVFLWREDFADSKRRGQRSKCPDRWLLFQFLSGRMIWSAAFCCVVVSFRFKLLPPSLTLLRCRTMVYMLVPFFVIGLSTIMIGQRSRTILVMELSTISVTKTRPPLLSGEI